MITSIGEGARAKLSALGVVLLLSVLVGAALAGRPAPAPPAPTLAVVAEVVPQTTPTAPPATPPATSASPPSPSPVPESLRHYIAGDDGIFGMPGYPWRGTKATTPQPRFVFNYHTRAPAGWVTR